LKTSGGAAGIKMRSRKSSNRRIHYLGCKHRCQVFIPQSLKVSIVIFLDGIIALDILVGTITPAVVIFLDVALTMRDRDRAVWLPNIL
jgi:hypothetical protein